jgi:hypothetical protein
MIIGCDYDPSFQQIAFVDVDTGELQERRLEHREEAEKFYRDLGRHTPEGDLRFARSQEGEFGDGRIRPQQPARLRASLTLHCGGQPVVTQCDPKVSVH